MYLHDSTCIYMSPLTAKNLATHSQFSTFCSQETPTDYLQKIKAKLQQTHLQFGKTNAGNGPWWPRSNFRSKDWIVLYTRCGISCFSSLNIQPQHHLPTGLPNRTITGVDHVQRCFGASQLHWNPIPGLSVRGPSCIIKRNRTIMHWYIL